MLIDITVPIMVDTFCIAEFDAAVEITVTYKGHRPSFDALRGVGDPGSGPEWEVDAVYVYPCMGDSKMAIPAPVSLCDFVNAYLGTDEARDAIICGIEDEEYAVS